jgi:tetratricopeptide (TPR) repeat protein
MQQIFEQLGDQRMLADSLHWESIWAARYSTYEHATETRQRSMDLRQKGRNQTVYFWCIFEMGDVHRIFGNHLKAREFYEEARRSFERIQLILGLGYCQRGLGDLDLQEGRYADALQHYQSFYAYAAQDNHLWSMVQASAKLALANAHLDEIEQARRDLFHCLDPLFLGRDSGLELMGFLAEAQCLFEEGKFEAAVALAGFITENPLTWNESRHLARAMLARLEDKLDEAAYQEATHRMQGMDVHQVTTAWLAGYEAQGADQTA